MGKLEDFLNVIKKSKVDAVSMASVLHYNTLNLSSIRSYGLSNNLDLREFNET